jgi:hypothetical protein
LHARETPSHQCSPLWPAAAPVVVPCPEEPKVDGLVAAVLGVTLVVYVLDQALHGVGVLGGHDVGQGGAMLVGCCTADPTMSGVAILARQAHLKGWGVWSRWTAPVVRHCVVR